MWHWSYIFLRKTIILSLFSLLLLRREFFKLIYMSIEVWYECFLNSLSDKFPKRSQLAEALMNLLCLEREAVYRRLRKDVAFHVYEVAKIASEWSISLDELINFSSEKIYFQIQLVDYLEPSDQDVSLLQTFIQGIHSSKNFPESEFMEICNKLPRPLLADYNYLNQFYLFKWVYQYGNKAETVPFSQIAISEKKRQLTAAYNKSIKQAPNTSFILDCKLFENLVNDIQYFNSIRLITDEEKEFIKKDLLTLLKYLLEVANKGFYPETKNKVNLYISQLSIDTNYSYISLGKVNICLVHAFDKYEVYTNNSKMTANFKEWMKLKKRTSAQISEVDEKNRIDYFMKQRQIVESL